MLHRFFDKTYVLSQWKRDDRQRLFEKEAARNELDYEWYWSTTHDNPHISFSLSQFGIIKEAFDRGHETVLVLEDDVQFQNQGLIPKIISTVPHDWEMLYFGCNAKPYDDHPLPTKQNDYWVRVRAAYTTHCVALRRGAMAHILDFYDPMESMYDDWLSRYLLPLYKSYCCIPFLATQRPSHSDLWNRSVDYTDTFKASEEYLKSI